MSCGRLDSRWSTAEMKSEIEKRVGAKNSRQYFMILGRFLSSKISKRDFDRVCIRLIGRENLILHNCFIRTILNNARHAGEISTKNRRAVGSLSVQVDNGYRGSCLQSLCEDGFPLSPRKGRTPTPRGRKFKDKLSPLGPLGKTPNAMSDDSPSKVLELPGASDILLTPGSRPPIEVKYVEDGEEVEQATGIQNVRSRSPITAPFGVCLIGSESKRLLNNSPTGFLAETCLKLCELPDTISLRTRLQEKVKENGLDVSVDLVNCLNKGIDMYLKSLIFPAVAIARTRSQKGLDYQGHYRTIQRSNGILPTSANQLTESATVSTLDFRAAMELNPTTLGKDWQIHLEKISQLESKNDIEPPPLD